MGDVGIESVVVVPYQKRFCKFYLNGSPEGHAKRYSDMANYLADLCPDISKELRDLTMSFQMFAVVVPSSEIIRFDREVNEQDLWDKVYAQITRIPTQKVAPEKFRREGQFAKVVDLFSRKSRSSR